MGAHPAHLRALWTQCFGDRPPAQHAPSHAATHPGQARAQVGSLYRHFPRSYCPKAGARTAYRSATKTEFGRYLSGSVGDLSMYPNQDAIFERLETTKKFGLLSDYLVSWVGRAGRLNPKVTVWGRDGTPEDVVEHYVARLLKGLVNDRHIVVAD